MSLRIPIEKDRVRKLDREDMAWARIPEDYWLVSFDQIPREFGYVKAVAKFIDNIAERVNGGRGLVLFGPHGHGKTSIAVIFMKEVIARAGDALFCPAESISSVAIERPEYEDGEDLWAAFRNVDLLVIDDLKREHVKDWGKSVIESLIRRRNESRRSTIVTTNAPQEELFEKYEAAMQALKQRALLVHVSGKDWRDED